MHQAFGLGQVIGRRRVKSYLVGRREPSLDNRVVVRFTGGKYHELIWAFCHTNITPVDRPAERIEHER